MRNYLKDPRTRGFVALGVLGLVVLALLWPVAIGRDARHLTAYRDGDEDLSWFREELLAAGAEVASIRSTPHLLDDVEDAAGTVLVVVGNERRYDRAEADAVVRFLERGGSVVLADETGFGTDVAREAGFLFSSERVLDESRNYGGDPSLVVADATLDGERYHLLFNAPASIGLLSSAAAHEVLAESSPSVGGEGSFLDKNANGEVDERDAAGPFPLVVRTRVGAGTLVLVADTGLFANAQMDVPTDRADPPVPLDNAAFAVALVQGLAPEGARVLLDESRHAPTPLLAPWSNGVRALARLTSGPLAPVVTLLVLLAAALLAWRFTRQTEDWSHHRHDVAQELRLPDDVRPDAARLQRMARRRISERFNMPLEQVAAMKTEELQALTGDRFLSEAASGALRGDPGPHFRAFSDSPSAEATP